MSAQSRRVSRRRRFTSSDRRRLVEAWRHSGLSQGRFAAAHGITASHLSRWKAEFPEGLDQEHSAQLVPVRIVDPDREGAPRTSDAFEVRLPTGTIIAVPRDFEPQALADLLGAVKAAAC